MKKVIILLLMTSLILVSCSQNNKTSNETISVDDFYNSSVQSFNECKDKEYNNIDMANTVLSISDVNKFKKIEISKQSHIRTDSDTYKIFKDICKYYFEDYKVDNVFFSSNSEKIKDESSEDDYYTWYPKAVDYENLITNNELDIDFFMYRDTVNNKYLWMHSNKNTPVWMNKGYIYSIIHSQDDKVSTWIPSDINQKGNTIYYDRVNEVLVGTSEKNSNLIKTIKYIEKEFLKEQPLPDKINYDLSVSDIEEYEINNEKVYLVYYSPKWNGIPFDRNNEIISDNDISHMYSASGEMLLTEKMNVDMYCGLDIPEIEEIGDEKKDICSLDNAISILSETLTNNVVFDLKKIEMVYAGKYDDNYTKAILTPSWKFILYNPNDDKYYNVYIDAFDQEVVYYKYAYYEN